VSQEWSMLLKKSSTDSVPPPRWINFDGINEQYARGLGGSSATVFSHAPDRGRRHGGLLNEI
jgi:hypothetical protein